MAKHHFVQEKYLRQWTSSADNQLNIYLIPTNEILRRGPGWKGFWRDDYNTLTDEKGTSDFPEKLTSTIDTAGITAIRALNPKKQRQLSGEDRSAIAFYIALQYTRTPRHREETDKLITAFGMDGMRERFPTIESLTMSKAELLQHKPKNVREAQALQEIAKLSEEELKVQAFEAIHRADMKARLSKTGHAKGILKVDRHAEKIFDMQWLFLVAPKGASFATSDSPCFTVSKHPQLNGLLSPHALVLFPLRPDILVCVKPSIASHTEYYQRISRDETKRLNALILSHSYECFIARDLPHLRTMTESYDHAAHRRSRDISISKDGPYTMYSAQ